MPLTDQDKQRIREEELYRLQVRQELQGAPNRWKAVAFWIVLVAVAVLLFAVIRSNRT